MYYYITVKEIAVAASEEKAAVVPYPTDEFDDVFSDEKIKKISHDIKKDLIAGVKINNIYFDTLVAAYIITLLAAATRLASLQWSIWDIAHRAVPQRRLCPLLLFTNI